MPGASSSNSAILRRLEAVKDELLSLGRTGAYGLRRGEVTENVVDLCYLNSSALEVLLRPRACSHEAFQKEDLLPVLEGETRLHLGPRGWRSLNHDGSLAKPGHDDVAPRKVVRGRRGVRPEL